MQSNLFKGDFMSYAVKEACKERDFNSKVISARMALLTKDIDYTKEGQTILIAKGTKILIDSSISAALIGNDHVTIFVDEYIFI